MQPFKDFTMIKYIILVVSILCLNACELGFAELNRDPFRPTQVEMGPLFNGVIESLTLRGDEQLFLHNENLYKLTQQASLTATTFNNLARGTEDVWSRYYLPMANVRDIQKRIDSYEGDPERMNNINAMLKTVIAFKTFKITDLFGDIPFFDAAKGFEGTEFVRPKFDSQEEIYKFLLDELKWVNDNVNLDVEPQTAEGESYLNLNGFDHLFNEDMLMWVKFANSLRLRHAIRMVDKDPEYAQAIIKEILDNNLPLIEKGEDVLLTPRALLWKKQSTHWSFREHRKLRMGSNIWNLMSESDALDGSGIFDSRARIFFEPNNAGDWSAYPQIPTDETAPSGGAPYDGVRDVNYSIKGNANIYSSFNYYLIRDEDDVPEILFTAAEVHFLKAESLVRGLGIPVNESQARAEYDKGIGGSILFWHGIVNSTQSWVNKPPALPINGEFTTINHPSVKFSGTDDKLKLIYTQRLIDAFRQPWEAYALSRRTKATPIEGEREIHYRFPYPPSEIDNNPENWSEQVALMGQDNETVKIWWIP